MALRAPTPPNDGHRAQAHSHSAAPRRRRRFRAPLRENPMPTPAPRSALPVLLLAACLLAGCATLDPAARRTDGIVAIGAVQGRGDTSPLLDQAVTVEGVVTGDFGHGLG